MRKQSLHAAGVFGGAPKFRYSYDEPIFFEGTSHIGYKRYGLPRRRVVLSPSGTKTDLIRKKIQDHRSLMYMNLVRYFDECGCGAYQEEVVL